MSENETFDATKKLLLNIRSVRVFARETSFEQLLEMQEKLNAVIEERREEAEREAAERAERERAPELLQLIAGEGFSPEELLGLSEDAQKHAKRRCQKRRLNISLMKTAKRNTGLVVVGHQNQSTKR